MGELLVVIIVPPIVGVVTYGILRLHWNRQNEVNRILREHHRDNDTAVGTR